MNAIFRIAWTALSVNKEKGTGGEVYESMRVCDCDVRRALHVLPNSHIASMDFQFFMRQV